MKAGLDDYLIAKGAENFKALVATKVYDETFLELQQNSLKVLDYKKKYDFEYVIDGSRTTFAKGRLKLTIEMQDQFAVVSCYENDMLQANDRIKLDSGTKKDGFVKRCNLDNDSSKTLRSFLDVIFEFNLIREKVLKNESTIKRRFNKICDASQSMSEEKRSRALQLAKRPDLLFRIKQLLEDMGLVGEALNGLLLYLALTSRLLSKPISVIIKGDSSSGKSYLVKLVLDLFPPDTYIELTGLSPKALIYLDEDFKHRFLIIYEVHGTRDEDYTEYLIRTLLSENMIRYAVVERNNYDGHQTRVIEREGPTGLITTTTHPSIHDENETRLFSIGISETTDQTKKIKAKIASDYQDIYSKDFKGDIEDLFNLQRVLKPLPVRIPYSTTLAELTPDEPLRMRRDFQRILAVIEIVALLNQHSRDKHEHNGVSYIEARLEDYYIAKALLEGPLSLTLLNRYPQTIEIVNAVEELHQVSHDPVLIKNLIEKFKRPRKTILRWLQPALDNGWIENVGEPGRGRAFKLVPGKFHDDEDNVLPTVELLCERLPELAENFHVIDPISGEEIRTEKT